MGVRFMTNTLVRKIMPGTDELAGVVVKSGDNDSAPEGTVYKWRKELVLVVVSSFRCNCLHPEWLFPRQLPFCSNGMFVSLSLCRNFARGCGCSGGRSAHADPD